MKFVQLPLNVIQDFDVITYANLCLVLMNEAAYQIMTVKVTLGVILVNVLIISQ